ncbi:hypothetical protein GCM10010211_15680 [Streptomyces albospinus]|uniref:Secreted protein n=1 Tax=Streptomyces albospinus TaxID=285515 RepID=A0ABQ2UVF3_9ACTN|nr:hypothetical protein GCM10010211_15680 [Streptomyces albospinus]
MIHLARIGRNRWWIVACVMWRAAGFGTWRAAGLGACRWPDLSCSGQPVAAVGAALSGRVGVMRSSGRAGGSGAGAGWEPRIGAQENGAVVPGTTAPKDRRVPQGSAMRGCPATRAALPRVPGGSVGPAGVTASKPRTVTASTPRTTAPHPP